MPFQKQVRAFTVCCVAPAACSGVLSTWGWCCSKCGIFIPPGAISIQLQDVPDNISPESRHQ